MLNYVVASSANTLVGTLTPNVPATIAANLQSSGDATVAMQSSNALFKITTWNGTPPNDPLRYHSSPVLTIYANLGTSGTKLVVTGFDSGNTQRFTQTFTSTGAALAFYQMKVPLAYVSVSNWTLQLSLATYSLAVFIDQVYMQYVSAGAVKDLNPISAVYGTGWSSSGGRDQYAVGASGNSRTGRMSYQFPGALLNTGDVVVAVEFIVDQIVNWQNQPLGTAQAIPYCYCQVWPLASPVVNTQSTAIDLGMFNGLAVTYVPNNIIQNPVYWGDIAFNWQAGYTQGGGYIPDTAKLNAGQVAVGFEIVFQNVQAGFLFPIYTFGSIGGGTPQRLRIYYDAIAAAPGGGQFFMEV
jgi:hypothetical protein